MILKILPSFASSVALLLFHDCPFVGILLIAITNLETLVDDAEIQKTTLNVFITS